MLYRERLWPTAWVWILAVCLTGSLGIAYGAAYGVVVGALAFIPLSVVVLGILIIAAPIVTVTSEHLRAGRAVIPCEVLTQCAELDSAGMRRALRLADPRLYMLVRPWSVRQGVIIEVDDPHDPHTSWLLSSRHPEALMQALAQAGVARYALNGERT